MNIMSVYLTIGLHILITIICGDVGSWNNWYTGYHVNDKHDGYLDIGKISFTPQNLNLSYSIKTNCSNDISLFANGRIYCTSNNMILSYYPQNGSIVFSYITPNDNYVKSPTFSKYRSALSLLAFSYAGYSSLNLYLVDPISGKLNDEKSMQQWSVSTYLVGSENGNIYFDSSEINDRSNPNIFAYDINSYNISQSEIVPDYTTRTTIPVICNDLIIISGSSASTFAYTQTPDFKLIWSWPSKGSGSSSSTPNAPICFKNKKNSYRIIVKPWGDSTSNNDCYLLNAKNGELLSEFKCGTIPILHYNKKTGIPNIAIIGTGYDQIVAVEMDEDGIGNQLWFGNGNIDYSFIVNNYCITAWKPSPTTALNVNIYNINTGDIVWNANFGGFYYDTTVSVFGGLVKEKQNDMYLMVIIRIGQTLYAFKEFD